MDERLARDTSKLSKRERRELMPLTFEVVKLFTDGFGMMDSISSSEVTPTGTWTYAWFRGDK